MCKYEQSEAVHPHPLVPLHYPAFEQASKKRKAEQPAALAATASQNKVGAAPAPMAAAVAGAGTGGASHGTHAAAAQVDEGEEGGAPMPEGSGAGAKKKRSAGEKKGREVKEYIPAMGSANYAFLITMLQVGGHTSWGVGGEMNQ
jgi:hypothetical protein